MQLRTKPWLVSIAVAAIAAAAVLGQAVAQVPDPAGSTDPSSALPLPTIPAPVPTALPAPEPDAIAELDTLLERLASADEKARNDAADIMANLDATSLPAIAAKLATLRKSADRDGMSRILEAARKRSRDARDKDEGDRGKANETPEVEHALVDPNRSDWLAFVLADPTPEAPGYKDLVAVLGLGRACACIETNAAAREVINIYTYFGDLFRIDVQRLLARMGDRGLPALIEAQYHDSRMVRTWAKRRLDVLGKAIPSEAVRTTDNQALADTLRTYGRVREVEAVRVIVSFANSDRLQVREAAREAIGQIGEPARWQLREAYENLMGRKPDRSWDWRRTARELFAVYDRARLRDVYVLMDKGLELYKQGQLQEAVKSFDGVLARAPLFERRAEMVPAYLDHAKAMRDKDPAAARAALRRAQLVDPAGAQHNVMQSELALLEAKDLGSRGIIDMVLLERAVQLDPGNAEARRMLDEARRDVEERQDHWRRYAAAIAVGVIALAAMLFIALSPRRRRNPELLEPPSPPTSEE